MRSLLRRRARSAKPALPQPPSSMEVALQDLFYADGTLSRQQFTNLVVPLLKHLHAACVKDDPNRADDQFSDVIAAISQACHRLANHRLPLGQGADDYRRYETHYNYALITAMAIGWYVKHSASNTRNPLALLARWVPPEGQARLQREPQVWQHWQGYFSGEEDGGLRVIASDTVALGEHAVSPLEAHPLRPNTTALPAGASTTPGSTTSPDVEPPQGKPRANPLARGWRVVEAIRAGLREGSLAYNRPNAPVQVDAEGRTFLQVPEVFEWCAAQLPGSESPKTLMYQFDRLGLCTRTPKGRNLLRGGRRDQARYQQGFVVEDATIFWEDAAPADQFYIRHLTRHDLSEVDPGHLEADAGSPA